MLKLTVTALLSASLAGFAVHRIDSYIVTNVLQSDDTSITRNVEQANALLDLYEASTKAHDIPSVVDIKRDGNGEETDVIDFLGERLFERINW